MVVSFVRGTDTQEGIVQRGCSAERKAPDGNGQGETGIGRQEEPSVRSEFRLHASRAQIVTRRNTGIDIDPADQKSQDGARDRLGERSFQIASVSTR